MSEEDIEKRKRIDCRVQYLEDYIIISALGSNPTSLSYK